MRVVNLYKNKCLYKKIRLAKTRPVLILELMALSRSIAAKHDYKIQYIWSLIAMAPFNILKRIHTQIFFAPVAMVVGRSV